MAGERLRIRILPTTGPLPWVTDPELGVELHQRQPEAAPKAGGDPSAIRLKCRRYPPEVDGALPPMAIQRAGGDVLSVMSTSQVVVSLLVSRKLRRRRPSASFGHWGCSVPVGQRGSRAPSFGRIRPAATRAATSASSACSETGASGSFPHDASANLADTRQAMGDAGVDHRVIHSHPPRVRPDRPLESQVGICRVNCWPRRRSRASVRDLERVGETARTDEASDAGAAIIAAPPMPKVSVMALSADVRVGVGLRSSR